MAERLDLSRARLEELLSRELGQFQRVLEDESRGLSDSQIERYMRAAAKFADQLKGGHPRTRGRKPRSRD